MFEGKNLANDNKVEPANEKYREAQSTMQQLIDDNNQTEFAAQASFLNALCAERMGASESAINY